MTAGLWQRGLSWCLCVALALAPLSGCSTLEQSPKLLHLAAVIVNGDRLARPDETGSVRIHRAGVPLAVVVGMELQTGDRVETGPNAHAVIRWPSGSELYMRPGSSGELGSLRAFFGECFVKVRGFFSIETEAVKTAADGTAFGVRTGPAGTSTVVVFDGGVRVESLRGAWPTVLISAGNMVTASASSQAPRPVPANPEELSRVHHWVDPIEKLLPPNAAMSAEVGGRVLVPLLAIGVLLTILMGKDKPGPKPESKTGKP